MVSMCTFVLLSVCYPTDSQGEDSQSAILNADGVYLATYSVLLLNLKLIKAGYYSSEEKSLPMAEVSRIGHELIQNVPSL